jgi:spore germination protein YaaH
MDDPKWRAQLTSTLIPVMAPADGIDLDFGGELPADARQSLTALVSEVANVVHPTKKLALHVPPSVKVPSDLPNGEAFSRPDLAKLVDRMRVMTLDYSIGGAPGPTIDPGWAVDAARLALTDFQGVDISYPLYGTDFGPRGARSVTYLEAMGVAAATQQPIGRGPTGAPFFAFVNAENEPHAIWFDDADSTGLALGAWTYQVVPQNVGVVFYGLGAEDPTLWNRIAERLQ